MPEALGGERLLWRQSARRDRPDGNVGLDVSELVVPQLHLLDSVLAPLEAFWGMLRHRCSDRCRRLSRMGIPTGAGGGRRWIGRCRWRGWWRCWWWVDSRTDCGQTRRRRWWGRCGWCWERGHGRSRRAVARCDWREYGRPRHPLCPGEWPYLLSGSLQSRGLHVRGTLSAQCCSDRYMDVRGSNSDRYRARARTRDVAASYESQLRDGAGHARQLPRVRNRCSVRRVRLEGW